MESLFDKCLITYERIFFHLHSTSTFMWQEFRLEQYCMYRMKVANYELQ